MANYRARNGRALRGAAPKIPRRSGSRRASGWAVQLAVVLLVSASTVGAAAQGDAMELSNGRVQVMIDGERGTILRLRDVAGDMDLQVAPDQAENYRLLVPVDEDKGNLILGKDQRLDRWMRSDTEATLHWDGPLTDVRGEAHDINVTMHVALVDDGASFTLELTNDSEGTVQEALYPFVGGLLAASEASAEAPDRITPVGMNDHKAVTRPFGQYDYGYPNNFAFQFVARGDAAQRGLYFGCHDTVARYKHLRFIEMGDGDASEVYATLVHMPFAKPGQVFAGAPAVFQFHAGDWVDAGAIYRDWFVDAFGLMTHEDDWIRRHGFYQMIMIMLPEGNVNYRIEEIPQLARDGLEYGITSLQIAGWQFGGHDNGYPYYEPDPRLGTWEELEAAIRACHELGVRVYFFVNIHVVNLDTEWYKTELKNYGWESESGDPYWIAGWGMGTLASRMAHTVPQMAFNDASFEGMAEGHLKYFRKLAEIGADGIHIDKLFPGHINMNPRSQYSPDQSVWEGTINLIQRIDEECRAINPEFRMSFECNWDRVLSYGAATWWGGNMSRAKRIFPELVETVGLYQPYDYIGVNNVILNGFVGMLSPHHFNLSMACPTWSGLSQYVAEVNRIREATADVIFFGEPLHGEGIVEFAEPVQDASVSVQAYRSRTTGKRGFVLVNNGSEPVVRTFTGFEGQTSGRATVHMPYAETVSLPLPVRIETPAERLAVVVEE